MRRTVLTLVFGLLVAPGAVAATAPVAPELAARAVSCQVGAVAVQRTAAFSGAMPAAEGASVLAMQFDLEQRRAGTWRVMAVPGFGRWERSATGAAGFVYSKRVERLAPGATYRVRVRFRWADADGRVVKRATRRSPACPQPDLRPALAVEAVELVEGLADGRARYVVRVRNSGGALIGTLRVGLVVDGVALTPQALGGLGSGESRAAAFEGPRCALGGALVGAVDPGAGAEEPRTDDNARRVPCPTEPSVPGRSSGATLWGP